MDLFGETPHLGGAEISTCERYRYTLWRIWDLSKPSCAFVWLGRVL